MQTESMDYRYKQAIIKMKVFRMFSIGVVKLANCTFPVKSKEAIHSRLYSATN